jgi:chemotaxis protein MotB
MFIKFNSIVLSFGVATLFASCAAHVKCGDTTAKAKTKYHGKRYNEALHERDSLCNLTKTQSAQLASLHADYSDLAAKYGKLSQTAGNLGNALNDKNATLSEKEAQLRNLQSLLRRQDSILNALNNSVKDALLGFGADELSVEMKNGKVYVSMSDKLLFKSGDATVEKKGRDALQKLAAVLNKNPDISISVEGHTDNVPIKTIVYKDNWDLSTARANNVIRLLSEEYGMDPHRLTASGRGEFYPVADNSTTEGKAKNRRTEIVLSPKLDELMKMISSR